MFSCRAQCSGVGTSVHTETWLHLHDLQVGDVHEAVLALADGVVLPLQLLRGHLLSGLALSFFLVRVWVLSFGVWVLGFDLGFWVLGSGFMVYGVEFQVRVLWVRGQGFGFRVSGFRLRVSGEMEMFMASGFRFRFSFFGVGTRRSRSDSL